jgi:hypothetical protein
LRPESAKTITLTQLSAKYEGRLIQRPFEFK